MKMLFRRRLTTFCAFCKSPRRIYRRKHVGPTNVLGCLLLAAMLTELLWAGPDGRGLVLFLMFLLTAETFVYLTWRAGLACRMCGFDPVIYKRSPDRASARVREFFVRAADDPQFWLSKSPLVEVHRRQREGERQRRELAALRSRRRPASAASAIVGSGDGVVLASKANENTRNNSDLQRA